MNHDHNKNYKNCLIFSYTINVTNQRYRLNYHIMPPAGWSNDPNGLSYFNGQYHAFFQYCPDNPNGCSTSWGHSISNDLVHWHYAQPTIAISPNQPYDRDGCWSGSAVVNDGQLTLIYAGNVQNPFNQTINIATSTDGVNFTKYSGNPVIAIPPFDGTTGFKDPKVWRSNGTWYVVISNPTQQPNFPRAVLYKSDDLKQWTYLGSLAAEVDDSENLGSMWDDPNFFYLNGKFILLTSAEGVLRDGNRFANLFQVGYFIGDFDYQTNFFNRSDFYELDLGYDFFAAQVFEDPKGRMILMAWMYTMGSPLPEQADGWAGALTLPRQLILSEDGTRVKMVPIEELKSLRGNQYVNSPIFINGQFDPKIPCDSTEVIMNISLLQAPGKRIGMRFGYMQLYYDRQYKKLVLARNKDIRQVDLGNITQVNLRVFFDKSSVEVFANDGAATMTSRFYSDPAPGLILFAESSNEMPGTANVNLQAFHLNSIYGNN
nr:putative GH32 family protein [Acrobeloides nanus]